MKEFNLKLLFQTFSSWFICSVVSTFHKYMMQHFLLSQNRKIMLSDDIHIQKPKKVFIFSIVVVFVYLFCLVLFVFFCFVLLLFVFFCFVFSSSSFALFFVCLLLLCFVLFFYFGFFFACFALLRFMFVFFCFAFRSFSFVLLLFCFLFFCFVCFLFLDSTSSLPLELMVFTGMKDIKRQFIEYF